MLKVEVKKLVDHAHIPRQMTESAAGYDLYSSNQDNINIDPGKGKMIPTGIAISLPCGYEAQIRPRSGLAAKENIGILNSPGTIDADYRGEIMVILFNFGERVFQVLPGMRIAQMVIAHHESVEFVISDDLPDSKRGENGFGHTETR